jgi:hypothetical protein
MALTTPTFLVLVVLWHCFTGLGIAGYLTSLEIIDSVNAGLPENERFDVLGWWYHSKIVRLHREYRRLYPTGPLLRRQGVIAECGLACMIIAALFLRFPPPIVVILFGALAGFVNWYTFIRNTKK